MPHNENEDLNKMVKRRHPEYLKMLPRWDFVEAHYDSQQLIDAVRNGGVGDAKEFLTKKAQSESREEYNERRKVSPYANYISPIIDSLVGLMASKSDETTRDWGALESAGLAETIQRDADGSGTDHEAQLNQLATDILLYQKVGILVDTNRPPEAGQISRQEAEQAGIRPFWQTIKPQSIINWRTDKRGNLVEALIREERDSRTSLADKQSLAQQEAFLWLTREGFARLQKRGGDVEIIEVGTYDYVNQEGQPTIPLFIAELPIRRYPAHSIAHLNNQIFNHESASLWWPMRKAGFARFIYDGDQNDFEDFKEEARAHGANIIHEGEQSSGNSRYVGPPTDAAELALQAREELVKALFRTATFEFSDQAAERTATEVNAEFLATIGSTLTTLAGAMDEAEGATLHLLEQAAGRDPGQASVQRTRDYTVKDKVSFAKEARDIIVGQNQSLPLPDEVVDALSESILESLGLIPEEELEELMEEAEEEEDEPMIEQEAEDVE